MNLTVTGHHVEVTDALRSSVTEKLGRVERHFDNVTDIRVILSVEKLRQKAEATVNVSGGTLFAEAIEGDMYAAIDQLADKLDRQVIKHKEKKKNHKHEKIQIDS